MQARKQVEVKARGTAAVAAVPAPSTRPESVRPNAAPRHEFKVGGSEFGPEMMILSLMYRMKVIQVPVLQDKVREPNETVFLALSALTADTTDVLLSSPTAVLTIVDDDGGASTGV